MTSDSRLLLEELRRVDAWLALALDRLEEQGVEAGDEWRGLFITHDRARAELDAALGEDDSLFDDDADSLPADGPVAALAATFGLTTLEQDIFLLALAPALDSRYQTLYGYLQNDLTSKAPRVGFALGLRCGSARAAWEQLALFRSDAPLFRHALLEPLPATADEPVLNALLRPDPAIVQGLVGAFTPHRLIAPHATLHPSDSAAPLPDHLHAPLTAGAVIVLHGADLARHDDTAFALAAHLQQPLLQVDFTQAADAAPAWARLALRDARLAHALPYFTGLDKTVADEQHLAAIVPLLDGVATPILLSATSRWYSPVPHQRPYWQEGLLKPTYGERIALWQSALTALVADLPSVEGVAGQFALTTRQIESAAVTARDSAFQNNAPLTEQDLVLAARRHSSPRLGQLARQIRPRFDWDDLILPDAQKELLHELIAMVRGRGLVLDEWGLGRKLVASAGVAALFAGPPGTGKTMAAEVIAGELGLDLYKIDLSSVVDKYIGETEKSLGKLFDEAQDGNAILFFDEADALFGKRGEVKDSADRYANIEVSYLLQRMEQYDGITILATNLRSQMDEAFTRRLQFALDFPFPDEHDRARLWQTLFPPTVPMGGDVDFHLLARRFKLAGGNIRNVIVSATYRAAANGHIVTMEHLFHGVRRELQKMGRLVDERMMAEVAR